jgi:uncharacterized protein (TIGR03435 family)
MTPVFRYLSFAVVLCGAAFAQTAETASPEAKSAEAKPKFEVADVHVSTATTNLFAKGPFIRGSRYELRTANMVDLIRAAYNMDAEKVLGGPSWLEMDRFDVIAKAPPKSTPETLSAMLQGLLVERFQLVVHNDTQPVPAYKLTVGKHPTLKKADVSEEGPKDGAPVGMGSTPGCKFTMPPPPGPPAGGGAPGPMVPTFTYTCHNITMEAFARDMRRMIAIQQYLGDTQVVDETELKGSWDFTFKYSLRGPVATAGDTITIFDAMEKQLGLKLERVKVPTAVLVVDSVNRKPTDNLAGVREALQIAAPPTEFEVADVKPTAPDFKGMRFNIQPGGRVNLGGVTLRFLMEQAWNVRGDMLVGAPKWLDTERFDIVAKAPTITSASGAGSGQQIDIDAIWLMFRALLADRFQLKVHNEERPVAAYTLVSVKPKLKKADPASRTRFQEGPAPDAKDPRNTNPALSRLVTVQNMTMAQFAEQLQRIAPGYIQSPVLDATGLEGAWDFALNFSPAGMAQMGAGRGGGRGGDGGGPAPVGAAAPGGAPAPGMGAAPEASDPSGGLTLLQAIEKQLGLKLEMQKRPVAVLVIDHIEQKPTEN